MRTQTRNAITVIGAVVALLAVVLAFVALNPRIFQPTVPGSGIETGQFAPAFTLQDVNGTAWNLTLHRGQVVLLDFMGARCATCAVEMGDGGLQSLYRTYSSRGFTILSIDVGGPLGTNNPAEAWRFVRGLNLDGSRRWEEGPWPVALDTQGVDLAYRVEPLPMKYLLDASGKIVWKRLGYAGTADTAALNAQITALLG